MKFYKEHRPTINETYSIYFSIKYFHSSSIQSENITILFYFKRKMNDGKIYQINFSKEQTEAELHHALPTLTDHPN